MLTRTAGLELGPHGVLVVGVGPGAVATPINVSTMQDPQADEDAGRRYTARGARPIPEEWAGWWLSWRTDGASYMTATTVFADGGIMQSSPGL